MCGGQQLFIRDVVLLSPREAANTLGIFQKNSAGCRGDFKKISPDVSVRSGVQGPTHRRWPPRGPLLRSPRSIETQNRTQTGEPPPPPPSARILVLPLHQTRDRIITWMRRSFGKRRQPGSRRARAARPPASAGVRGQVPRRPRPGSRRCATSPEPPTFASGESRAFGARHTARTKGTQATARVG